MKFVKFGILALSMGLFIASCGNGGNKAEGSNADTAMAAPAATPEATAPAATDSASATATAPADSTKAMPAADSTKK